MKFFDAVVAFLREFQKGFLTVKASQNDVFIGRIFYNSWSKCISAYSQKGFVIFLRFRIGNKAQGLLWLHILFGLLKNLQIKVCSVLGRPVLVEHIKIELHNDQKGKDQQGNLTPQVHVAFLPGVIVNRP